MLPILGNMNIAFILAFLCFSMMMDFGHCQCLTTPKSPSPNQPCAFPFVYNGKTNTNCITDNDPEGLFWCSTQVDSNRKHIAGRGMPLIPYTIHYTINKLTYQAFGAGAQLNASAMVILQGHLRSHKMKLQVEPTNQRKKNKLVEHIWALVKSLEVW